MEPSALRALFDAQVRQSTQPDGSGGLAERDQHVLRWVAVDGRGWSGITWSELDPACADAVIAEQIAHFTGLGEPFEWKLYDYDAPADLDKRLAAAGFSAGDDEALMIAAVSNVPPVVALPDGVRLQPVTDESGVELLIAVNEQVFGTEHSQLRAALLAQLDAAPELITLSVVMAGDEPVSSARIEFLPGRDFASLWGGGTLPAWRRRGIYRALVAHRAQLAAARGYRFLQVDASAQSRPVLERLGFASLAVTTPFAWSPTQGA